MRIICLANRFPIFIREIFSHFFDSGSGGQQVLSHGLIVFENVIAVVANNLLDVLCFAATKSSV